VWCHSPEGISTEIGIWYDKSLCIACGECVKACQAKALCLKSDIEPSIQINHTICILTGDCINVCPTGALQFTGSEISVSDVINEIEKDILYFEKSGGGVTLTGGEPLYQPEFSIEILKSCRQKNIHTAIETCLFCEENIIAEIAEYVDLFIVDMKVFDNIQHTLYTGKPNMIIKKNFRYIAALGKEILVRIPLVDDITNTQENLAAIAGFVNETRSDIPIENMDFNPLAENNYKRLGIPFLLKNFPGSL
jgi:pyruvate formate lyase activating enzyme